MAYGRNTKRGKGSWSNQDRARWLKKRNSKVQFGRGRQKWSGSQYSRSKQQRPKLEPGQLLPEGTEIMIFASQLASLVGIGKFSNPEKIKSEIRERLGAGSVSRKVKDERNMETLATQNRNVDTSIVACASRLRSIAEETEEEAKEEVKEVKAADVEVAAKQIQSLEPSIKKEEAQRVAKVVLTRPECVVLPHQVQAYEKAVEKVVTCEKGDVGESIVVQRESIKGEQCTVKRRFVTAEGRRVLLFGKCDGVEEDGTPIEIKTRTKGYFTGYPWQQERVQMMVYMFCTSKQVCVFKQYNSQNGETKTEIYKWDEELWASILAKLDVALSDVVIGASNKCHKRDKTEEVDVAMEKEEEEENLFLSESDSE